MEQIESTNKNGKTIKKLVIIVMLMFGFSFLLVPLYDVICRVTGFNGKTEGKYEVTQQELETDGSRRVTVQFLTSLNAGMEWDFKPMQGKVKVHPGEKTTVSFYVKNPTEKMMIAQAIPSVSPSSMTSYLHKMECFCFQRQELQPGEEKEMSLVFFIDKETPTEISKLTLSYSLFDITDDVKG